MQTVTTGAAPRSVTEHAGLVVVLNTGDPSVAGFRMEDSKLVPVDDAGRRLPAGSDPAQVGFGADGRTLFVTDRAADAIVAFPVLAHGTLGEPSVTPSSGPTPYGFAVTHSGVLVVTEAFGARKGAAAASSYRLVDGVPSPVTRSAGNGRSEICWAVVTPDGRFAFTTNFADGAVSAWSVAADGSLELRDATAGLTQDGRPGLRDADLSADGRFLYALDADAHRIYGWSVEAHWSLAPIASWAGLPATAAGLAAS